MDATTWDDPLLSALLSLLGGEAAEPVNRLPDSAERALIEGLRGGDPGALQELYREYADPLRRLVLAPRLGSRERVLDLLHETFLVAARRGPDFRWEGVGFFPWLRGIALNLVRREVRRQGREAAARVPLEDALPWLVSARGVESELVLRERLEEIRKHLAEALGQLRERDRQVVRLRLLERQSSREAAAELGVSPGHLDVLLFRALRRLRAAYSQALERFERSSGGA